MGGADIDGSQYASQTCTVLSKEHAGERPVRSLNHVNPSPQNVERLFFEACIKIKESINSKKLPFDLPEHLQGTALPVEAIAFEKDILILIAKKMGVVLPHMLAIEAILVARKQDKKNAKS